MCLKHLQDSTWPMEGRSWFERPLQKGVLS